MPVFLFRLDENRSAYLAFLVSETRMLQNFNAGAHLQRWAGHCGGGFTQLSSLGETVK